MMFEVKELEAPSAASKASTAPTENVNRPHHFAAQIELRLGKELR